MAPRPGLRLLTPTPALRVCEPTARLRSPRPVLVVEGRACPVAAPVTLGSGPEVDLRVGDPHVSTSHCRIAPAGRGQVAFTDLGSTNGLWHRGRTVQRVTLGVDDVASAGRLPVIVADGEGGGRAPGAVRWQGLTARDPRSLALLGELAGAAAARAPVALRGESGTGKELAARALHGASERRDGPFVALNCAALPDALAEGELFGVERGAYTGADRARPGAFARADGGTLLLDEVGELSPAIQAKLLRVLETGELQPVGGRRAVQVDVRVVTATWRDLVEEVALGRFRFDLLQRLQVLRVALPALRERPRDVAPLLEAFFAAEGLAGGWPEPATVRLLERAPWPGNVRQLRSAVTRFAIFGDPAALATAGFGGRLPASAGAAAGAAALGHALAKHHGNRAAAARDLGISRSTLYRWLGRVG